MRVEESINDLTVEALTYHYLVFSLDPEFKREAYHLLWQIDFQGPMTIRVDGQVMINNLPTNLYFPEVFVRLHEHRPPNGNAEEFLRLLRTHQIVGVLYAPPCERYFW